MSSQPDYIPAVMKKIILQVQKDIMLTWLKSHFSIQMYPK